MSFFEYESREIVEAGRDPRSPHGFATTAEEARRIAAGDRRPGRDQVPGPDRRPHEGRRREVRRHAGGGRARTPSDILELEINGHMPRGVLVDSRAAVEQEYYAGVDVGRHAQAAGDDLLATWAASTSRRSPRAPRPASAARHFSTVRPFADFQAKEVIASTGVTGRPLNRLTPILARLARLFVEYDMTLAEINPLGGARRRHVRRGRRAHGHGERGRGRARRRC